MSKKINTTAIGLFIVAGLALGVAGVLIFSSSKLFSKTLEVIVYFDQTLNGLDEGAPVKYRGVTIGAVKQVMVRFNQAPFDYAMPVVLELEERLLRERMGGRPTDIFNESALKERIRQGLRASLQTESLVTGVLYVDIRIRPNAPPPVFHQLAKFYPEIPTEPTQIQQLFDNLATLDIKSIETNLNRVLAKLDVTVGKLDVAQINQGVTNLLVSLERLVSSSDITNGLASIQPTLEQYRALGEKLNNQVAPLSNNLSNSLAEANRTLAQFRGAAENLRTLTASDSALRNDLSHALRELGNAAQSIAVLVEFLNQHPNALITGRQMPKKQP